MVRLASFSLVRFACIASLSAGCSVFFPSNDIAPPKSAALSPVHPVRVNSVGYLTDRQKLATVVLTDTSTPSDMTVQVRAVADDSVVWSGTLAAPTTDAATAATVMMADFTAFNETGEFYVAVPGIKVDDKAARSAPFHVGPDAFAGLLDRAMAGMYGQRCGQAVRYDMDGQTFSHAACHKQDGYLDYATGESVIKASPGGWHDAGDYGKYMTNGAFTVGMMLQAWEHFTATLQTLQMPMIPEHNGYIPDYLAEVKYEIDWLLTTPFPDGGVSHKLTRLDFEGFIMPEQDGGRRYFTEVGTSATANVVAVLAQASRIYRPFDAAYADKCLAAAQLSWSYLATKDGPYSPNSELYKMFKTGGYGESTDADNRSWAAAELWETTGDAALLTDLESRIRNTTVDTNFDWDNMNNMGVFTYLMSKREGRDPAVVQSLTTKAIASADGIAGRAQSNPFGRGLANYWWGSNGAVARTAMNLSVANALNPDPKYLDAIVSQLDFLLGRNIYDRTQVTGVGYNPPMKPHHRPSAADGKEAPWPGLLVGGSDKMPTGWKDDQASANLNEIAINWNGALIYAAAALVPPPAAP